MYAVLAARARCPSDGVRWCGVVARRHPAGRLAGHRPARCPPLRHQPRGSDLYLESTLTLEQMFLLRHRFYFIVLSLPP